MGANSIIYNFLCAYYNTYFFNISKIAALSTVKCLILIISGVKINEGIKENKPTIVMYNHKSYFDIFHLLHL